MWIRVPRHNRSIHSAIKGGVTCATNCRRRWLKLRVVVSWSAFAQTNRATPPFNPNTVYSRTFALDCAKSTPPMRLTTLANVTGTKNIRCRFLLSTPCSTLWAVTAFSASCSASSARLRSAATSVAESRAMMRLSSNSCSRFRIRCKSVRTSSACCRQENAHMLNTDANGNRLANDQVRNRCKRTSALFVVRSQTEIFLKWTKKIMSFRSECLKTQANEHCYGEFQYICETNDRNVSAKKKQLLHHLTPHIQLRKTAGFGKT